MLQRIASLLRIQPPAVADEGLLFASGPTVPTDATTGYQPGCLFQHTDGGAGTVLYVNEGTNASCLFAAIAALTAAQELLLSATPGTAAASKALIVDANIDIDTIRNLGATGTLTIGDIEVTSKWDVGIAGGAIVVGDYSTPIAFGEVTEHVVGVCVHLSGSTDDDSNFIPIHGKFTTTADCAANAVAQAIYGRVDVNHDINGVYGVRGAISVGADTPAVHQAYALFGTLAMDTCSISGTGGYLAALALEVSGTTDVTGDGKVCGSRIAWGQTNAMTVETVGSMIAVASGATLDSGFRVDASGSVTNGFHSFANNGTITTGLKLESAHTNAFQFPANGTAPIAEASVTGHGGTVVQISVLVGNSQYYMLASTAPASI